MRTRVRYLLRRMASIATSWHPKLIEEALGKRADDLWTELTNVQKQLEKKEPPLGVWPPPVDTLLGPKNDMFALAKRVDEEFKRIEAKAKKLLKDAERYK